MNKPVTTPQFVFALVMLFVTYIFIMPRSGHGWDTQCWINWASAIKDQGLGNVYKTDANYNPFYLYVLYVYGTIQDNAWDMQQNIYLLKAFTLVFDFAGAIIAARFIANENAKLFFPFVLLLNIAYLYNTVVWGQVDSIFTTLAFISVYFLIKRQLLAAFVFYVLAINMKLQAIIFLPPLLLLMLPELRTRSFFKQILPATVIIVGIQALILVPFIMAGDFSRFIDMNFNSVGFFPVVSMNAFNFWHLLLSGDLMKTPDETIFAGLSYKHWGLLLFFITSAVVLLPMAITAVKGFLKKQVMFNYEIIFLSFALIPLLFFFFNTQMHERYSHPSMLFLAAYGFVSGRYLLLGLFCAGYFLNMEKVFQFMGLKHYGTLIFDPVLIAAIFGLLILLGTIRLYRLYNLKQEVTSLLPQKQKTAVY